MAKGKNDALFRALLQETGFIETRRERTQRESRERLRERSLLRNRENYGKAKDRRAAERINCINHYGNVCACCGETTIEFLTIDHTDGKGAEWRRKHRVQAGIPTYRWLRFNNYPEGFRTLCYNCNSSFGFYGYCPHENNGKRHHNNGVTLVTSPGL